MAEYGEWTRKGATLSHVTAAKEYGVNEAFIVQGIRAGRLEYRQGSVWGNSYIRVLRSQLEKYIAEKQGGKRLAKSRQQTELRKIENEIRQLKKRLSELEARKADLEGA
jgi:coenzyme F420-reducing hydrogenase delta subunit